jgi:intracellular multiplication protein IcmC
MLLMPRYSPAQVLASVKRLAIYSLFVLFLYLLEDGAVAADISTILRNIRTNVIVPLTALLLCVSYVAGIIMIFRAITMFKKFGMMMTHHSQPGEFSGPLTYIMVGAALIYLPTSTDLFLSSLFGTVESIFGSSGAANFAAMGRGADLLGYASGSSFEAQWADFANTLILFVQFIGFLSFIKGWFILAKAGQPGGAHQGGGLGKAFTHLVGGVIAINLPGVINILQNTIYGS